MRVLYINPVLWQAVVDANGFGVFEEPVATDTVRAWAGSSDLVYKTDVEHGAAAGQYDTYVVANPSRVAVASEDEAIARIVGLGANLSPRQADGSPLIAQQGRIGKECIYATHNLCDETTWYSESARVTDEALVDSGDGLTFTSANPSWVDMVHGKVFDEEGLAEDQQLFEPGDPHGYAVVVKVDGVEMVERSAFDASGGDYIVDYGAGSVTFFVSQAGKAVTASYSYASSSAWILRPLAGKALVIEKAEVQFAKDAQMQSAFIMEVYGLVDFFAPHLMTTANPPGPLPPGTPIPIEGTTYKTVDQLVDEAVLAYPEIPAMGGARGFTQPRHVFQFHYAAVRTIWSSLGMYLRISMQNDTSFSGERATATFYCLSKTDPGPAQALALLTAE